jgi:hypothetical protein
MPLLQKGNLFGHPRSSARRRCVFLAGAWLVSLRGGIATIKNGAQLKIRPGHLLAHLIPHDVSRLHDDDVKLSMGRDARNAVMPTLDRLTYSYEDPRVDENDHAAQSHCSWLPVFARHQGGQCPLRHWSTGSRQQWRPSGHRTRESADPAACADDQGRDGNGRRVDKRRHIEPDTRP